MITLTEETLEKFETDGVQVRRHGSEPAKKPPENPLANKFDALAEKQTAMGKQMVAVTDLIEILLTEKDAPKTATFAIQRNAKGFLESMTATIKGLAYKFTMHRNKAGFVDSIKMMQNVEGNQS